MGNTPSTEVPPRRPQRLSKPPIGSYPSTTTPRLPSSDVAPAPKCISDSDVATTPAASHETLPPTETSVSGIGTAVTVNETENIMTGPIRRNERRNSGRMGDLFRSKSSQTDSNRRKQSIISTVSSRANSLVRESGLYSLTRAASQQANEEQAFLKEPVDNELRPSPNTMSPSSLNEHSHQSSPDNLVSPDSPHVNHSTWKSSHPHELESSPVTRSNSDASLYMPVRRRSLIQTPGVATRSHGHQVSAKSSILESVPPSPNQSRRNSVGSSSGSFLGIAGTRPQERVVTPCESDYKQLGAIKFGSLRITNGISPAPSPGPDSESDVSQTPDLFKKSGNRSYFQPSLPPNSNTSSCVVDQLGDPVIRPRQSIPRIVSPIQEDEYYDTFEYISTEVLDIREDPNAKPTFERIQFELNRKTVSSLTRSDSGFVSSPSSEGSSRALSKADSGYSSNTSLRSRDSIKEAERRSSKPQPSAHHHTVRPSAKPAMAFPTKSTEGLRKAASQELLTKSENKGSHRSLPSLARGNTLPTILPRERSKSETPSPDKSQNASIAECASPRGSRLQRILSGSRSRGPPKVRDIHGLRQRTRLSSSNEDEELKPPPVLRHVSLRGEASKETLRTIMSVGSTDMLQNQSHDVKTVEIKPEGGKSPIADNARPQPSRKRSLHARTQSFTQAAAALFSGKLSSSKDAARKGTETPEKPKPQGLEPVSVSSATTGPLPSPSPSTSPGQASHQSTVPKRSLSRPAHMDSRNRRPSSTLRSNKSSPHLGPQERRSLAPSDLLNDRIKSPQPSVGLRARNGQKTPISPKSMSLPNSPTTLTPMGRPIMSRNSGRSNSHLQQTQGVSQTRSTGVRNRGSHQSSQQWSTGTNGSHQQLVQSHSRHTMHSSGNHSSRPRRASAPSYQALSSPVSSTQPTYNGQVLPRGRSMSNVNSLPHQWQPQLQFQPVLQPLPSQMQVQDVWMQNMFYQQHGFYPTPKLVHGQYDPYQQQQQIMQHQQQHYQHHQRAGSHGTLQGGVNPPFRVLHSYNSPAYRGVPIWG